MFWLPIIGPIIQGIVSIFTKAEDTSLGKLKIDADVHTVEVKSSEQTLRDFHDDISVRICRDIILFPGSLWIGSIVWSKLIERNYPDLVWAVNPIPDSIAYLPLAIMTFLFGVIATSAWKNR